MTFYFCIAVTLAVGLPLHVTGAPDLTQTLKLASSNSGLTSASVSRCHPEARQVCQTRKPCVQCREDCVPNQYCIEKIVPEESCWRERVCHRGPRLQCSVVHRRVCPEVHKDPQPSREGPSVKYLAVKAILTQAKALLKGDFDDGCEWKPFEECVDVSVNQCHYVKRCNERVEQKIQAQCAPICKKICTEEPECRECTTEIQRICEPASLEDYKSY